MQGQFPLDYKYRRVSISIPNPLLTPPKFSRLIMTLDQSQGLLFVLAECGPHLSEEEFNDVCDNEHSPARLAVKGFNSALRYRAIDDGTPKCLVMYDVDTTEVLFGQEYQSLRGKASQRELDVFSKMVIRNRRIYSQISAFTLPTTAPSSVPGKYAFIVGVEITAEGEAEFNKWYREEHMVLLSKVPGWLRGRRYKCVSQAEMAPGADKSSDANPLPYIAIHEFDRADFLELPEYKNSVSTPWGDKIRKTAVRREARTFELCKSIGKPL